MKKILTILMLLFSLTLMAINTHSPDMADCVGYWSLNENSLNSAQAFTDLSGNGNLGTSANVPTFSADQNGCNSQSVLFNGTTDLINCGSGATIDNIFDGGGTVSAWINPSSDGESDAGRLFFKRDTGLGWIITTPNESAGFVKISFWYEFSTTQGNWITTNAVIPINIWTHIAIIYDNDSVTNNPIFYINGIAYLVGSGLTESSTPVGTRGTDVAQTLYLGNQSTTATTFDGSISDCLIYNTALTSDQVSKIYEAGRSTATVEMDDSSTSYLTYPTTTGNLALDMPLCEPYTDGGGELATTTFANNVTYPWDTYTGESATGFIATESDGSRAIAYSSYAFESGKQYLVSFDYTIANLSSRVDFQLGSSSALGTQIIYSMLTDETSSYSGIITPNDNYVNYGFRMEAGRTGDLTVSNFSITELNATTKDLSYSQASGAVSGATIQYDGLANVSAGIAYVPSDVAYGEWEFNVNKGADGNTLSIYFISPNETFTNSSYRVYLNSSERIRLASSDGVLFGSVDAYISSNIDYRIKVTRSLAGVFTVYIKGGAFGWDSWTTVVAGEQGTNPVTDNTYTSSSYFVMDLDASDSISGLEINGNPISLQSATQSTGSWTTTAPSYDFNGTTDYIAIDDTDALSFGNGTTDSPFSISAWVNMDDAADFVIFSKGSAASREYVFETTGSKLYLILFDDNNTKQEGRRYDTAITSYEGQWIHLIATYDGRGGTGADSGINIYLNGIVVDDVSFSVGTYTAMHNQTQGATIGRFMTDGAVYTNGQIKGLKIWNKELTQTEITYEYNTSWRR